MRFSTLLLFILLSISTLQAQNLGKIEGYVLDAQTEEPLPFASVVIDGTSTGTTTNAEGFYQITSVEPKTYNLTASFVGFESQTKFLVVVRSGTVTSVNFQLMESSNTLNEVNVVANPFTREKETPLSIQKLSAEEVATYPGGNNDIAKVVQSLPGVSGSVGGFRNDVIIRGGAPNENVYYLDGVEIPNINHFSTQGSAGGPVGMLNVSFFEGVTLNSSSFPARYDNALSGVLEFDQRDGNNRTYLTNLRLSASEAAATFEGPLFKKKNEETSNTSFIASVRRSYLQFLFQLIDLPFLPDYWDYQYKVTHKVDALNEITITGIGSIDDFQINVPEEYDPDQQATLEQVPVIKQWSSAGGVTWKCKLKDYSGFMTTTLSSNILNNEFRQFADNVNQTDLYFQNISTEWETKLRYRYTKFVGDWKLEGGASTQYADYTNNTRDLTNGFDFNSAVDFYKYGMFGQASYADPGSKWAFSGGFRMDGNTFTETGNEVWRTFSPRLSASYNLDDERKWSINGSIGRYYKLPPYTILGFIDNGLFANQNVAYIQSDHLVLGLEHLLTKTSRISVEGFYKNYEQYPVSLTDSISLANLGGGFEVLGNEPVASVGNGRTYGVELLYQQKFTGNWYAILAVTLYRSEFTAFDEDEYLPSAWDNGQLVTLTAGYRFGKNWELSLRNRYLGPTPYAPVDEAATLLGYPNIIYDYDRLGEEELEAFNQLDVRLDKKWNFKGFSLDVFLDIQNILSANTPNTPSYGLARTDAGDLIRPQQLVQIAETDDGSLIPSIGLVVNF